MLSTVGGILTGCGVLLSLLSIGIALKCWLAARAAHASMLDSAATPEAKDLRALESRLRELEADLVSLSSSYEKVARQLVRLNSRAGMRELREGSSASQAPPPGAPKAEVLRFYGMAGKTGPAFAQAQMQLEQRPTTERS